MSLGHGSNTVRNGLLLNLDAANPKSYPGSGTAWNDISRNGNNGTLFNGVGYNTDNKGAMVFDGVNDYVDCGPVAAVGSSLTGLTVSLWFNSFQKKTGILAENGSSFSSNTFYIAQENTTVLSFLICDQANAVDRIYAGTSYDINTWYNFVGTWESGARCKAFINSVDVSSAPFGGVMTNVKSGNTNLMIARRPNGALNFNGLITDFSIYDRALQPEEIKQNFEALRGRYGI